jgi:hypothetical protein
LCSLHSGRQRTAGLLASRRLGRPRSGHRREREATHAPSPSCWAASSADWEYPARSSA